MEKHLSGPKTEQVSTVSSAGINCNHLMRRLTFEQTCVARVVVVIPGCWNFLFQFYPLNLIFTFCVSRFSDIETIEREIAVWAELHNWYVLKRTKVTAS